MEPSKPSSGHWKEIGKPEASGIQHVVDDNKQPIPPQLQQFHVKLRVGGVTKW
jgi:hypothetical protein